MQSEPPSTVLSPVASFLSIRLGVEGAAEGRHDSAAPIAVAGRRIHEFGCRDRPPAGVLERPSANLTALSESAGSGIG